MSNRLEFRDRGGGSAAHSVCGSRRPRRVARGQGRRLDAPAPAPPPAPPPRPGPQTLLTPTPCFSLHPPLRPWERLLRFLGQVHALKRRAPNNFTLRMFQSYAIMMFKFLNTGLHCIMFEYLIRPCTPYLDFDAAGGIIISQVQLVT